MDEIILKGGRANTGNVVRVGDQVARPTYPQTPSVEHFLKHLLDQGLTFVPEPIGTDDQGRHRLSFVKGVAPMPPYPAWAFGEALLVEVAQHQRDLHMAARSYVAEAQAIWAVSAGDYFPPRATASTDVIVCHNDLGMSNTIVDAESKRFVGFIDFDYCRPVDPLFDIAVAIRHWAPFGDLDLGATIDLDRVGRFSVFCDVHELEPDERLRVVALAVDFLDQARDNIAKLAAAGQGGFQALLDGGYEATNRATVRWLRDHAETLATT